MFQLREINQMEREMCQYLDWELNIEPSTPKEFEAMVRKDFAGPGPYPTYVLQTISKLAATFTDPFPVIASNSGTSPIHVRTSLAQDYTPHMSSKQSQNSQQRPLIPSPQSPPTRVRVQSHHSALVKHLRQNQPLPRQYPQTPKSIPHTPHHA
jgi:hypothetical protein